jgi:hypothetical protein
MASSTPRVLILGHSFVRRLGDFVDNRLEGTVSNFDLPCDVSFIGTGGCKLPHLWIQLPRILATRPDIVVLDIGTNDLSSPSCIPGDLADSVYQFAMYLVSDCGVKAIHIAQIFPRLFTTGRTPADFNDKAFVYNAALRSICYHGQTRDRAPPLPIFMFVFRGMSRYWASYLSPIDGVHFAEVPQDSFPYSGSYKYYRSVKACIAVALRMPEFQQ